MSADIWSEDFQNQVGKAVDHPRFIFESWRGIDHAEYAQPGADAIQTAELALQTPENGQRRQPG